MVSYRLVHLRSITHGHKSPSMAMAVRIYRITRFTDNLTSGKSSFPVDRTKSAMVHCYVHHRVPLTSGSEVFSWLSELHLSTRMSQRKVLQHKPE